MLLPPVKVMAFACPVAPGPPMMLPLLTIVRFEPAMAAAPGPGMLEPPSIMLPLFNVRFEFEAAIPTPAVPLKVPPP
jgi:hypothetical protein